MTKKVVPRQVTIVCDKCGMNDRKMYASVHFQGAALDIYGDPVASADFSIDLCDKCATKFYNEWGLAR